MSRIGEYWTWADACFIILEDHPEWSIEQQLAEVRRLEAIDPEHFIKILCARSEAADLAAAIAPPIHSRTPGFFARIRAFWTRTNR